MLNPLPIAATFSKDPKFYGAGFLPAEVAGGFGATEEGHDPSYSYLSWISALGANLIGYPVEGSGDAASEWARRVTIQVWQGAGFSLPHRLERQVAEKMVTLLGTRVPGWSPEYLGLRFGLSGTDATTMAVRLARAVTGRERVLSYGYHGYGDWSISVAPPAWGIVRGQQVEDIAWGDWARLEEQATGGAAIAAVILEVPIQEAPEHWYAQLRQLCDQTGALLILDEVVTWPRFALGGAAELYGIRPDIACYGKALGNGIPISCMVGRREFFAWFSRRDPVFISSTHFGNAVSLAAADAVLDLWNQAGVDHLWKIGEALMAGLRAAGYDIVGHPPRSLLQFTSNSERGYFILGMRDRGILMNRPNLPNLAHTLADVGRTIEAAAEVKAEMGNVDIAEVMRGREPAVLFEGR